MQESSHYARSGKILRVEPVHDIDSSASPDELRRAVADSRASGDLPDDLALLIDRVLDFPGENVEHAMTPRSQVATVKHDTTLAELRVMMARAHSRYPVVDASGEPVGVVALTDLLRSRAAEEAPVKVIMREPVLVPTLMSLPDALAQMGETRAQMACVVDEYGGFAGILTTEDIAEELVGEITDEHDEGPADGIVVERERSWRVDGGMHLDEVERVVGYELPDGDYETVAGLVIAVHGDFPEVGQTVRIPLADDPADLVLPQPIRRALDVETLSVHRHVPASLRIDLVEVPGPGESDAEVDR